MTPRFFDRSRQGAYFRCPRQRFLGYEFGGRGLATTKEPYYFASGSLIHTGLQALLMGQGVEEVCQEIQQWRPSGDVEFEPETPEAYGLMEQRDLAEALVRAFALTRLDVIKEEYEVLGTEVPINVELGSLREPPSGAQVPLVGMFRLDAIWSRLDDGAVFPWELKSTSNASASWIGGWDFNIQLMAETLAASRQYGERVKGLLLEGVIKGVRKKGKDGFYLQNSDLIYCYTRGSIIPGSAATEVAKGWRKGFDKRLVSGVVPGGIREWLETFSEEDLLAAFVALPPLPRRLEREERWKRQTVALEGRILNLVGQVSPYREGDEGWWDQLDELFPQNTNECGFCAFKEICHSPSVRRQLSLTGKFMWRTPNHQLEKEWFEQHDWRQEGDFAEFNGACGNGGA